MASNPEQPIPDGFGLVLIAHESDISAVDNTLRLAPELRYPSKKLSSTA